MARIPDAEDFRRKRDKAEEAHAMVGQYDPDLYQSAECRRICQQVREIQERIARFLTEQAELAEKLAEQAARLEERMLDRTQRLKNLRATTGLLLPTR